MGLGGYFNPNTPSLGNQQSRRNTIYGTETLSILLKILPTEAGKKAYKINKNTQIWPSLLYRAGTEGPIFTLFVMVFHIADLITRAKF